MPKGGGSDMTAVIILAGLDLGYSSGTACLNGQTPDAPHHKK